MYLNQVMPARATEIQALGDVYNETEEVELQDDMLLRSIEKHTNFSEAPK